MLSPVTVIAMDDWKRLQIFDAAASFVEFQPPPPTAIPTISAASVLDPVGSTQIGRLAPRLLPVSPWSTRGRHVKGLHPIPLYGPSWSPAPQVLPNPPGASLTLGTVDFATNPTQIRVPISGGVAGATYNLKAKFTLSTGAKLSIPIIYSVVAPGNSPINPGSLNHLIDPNDSTTWTRDYVFDFSSFAELSGSSPPAIASATVPAVSGLTIVSTRAAGTAVVVRIYCTAAGSYSLRCKITLSDTLGTQLSIPGVLNAVLWTW